MNKLAKILNKKDKEVFDEFKNSLKKEIKTWDYFVDWQNVLEKVDKYKIQLNILNSLIGEQKISQKLKELIKKYPEIIETFPILLAIRDKEVNVLIDIQNFVFRHFNFTKKKLTESEISYLSDFIINSGFSELLKNKTIKNLVDYITGVEVGIQTNARKNRTGKLMEKIVESFIIKTSLKNKLHYLPQATKEKIKKNWNLDIKIDKSNRRIDFAILKNKKLFFIETNFYAGGGSKLKATAGEYISMAEFWNKQNIEFIWITDGYGWKTALAPLEEYFSKGYYLLNLEMLSKYFEKIISKDA